MTQPQNTSTRLQTFVGAGVALLGLGLGAGAISIPSASGYAGVGPNFLPWLVAVALTLCGAVMVYESRSGGFRNLDAPEGDKPYWPGFVWMSAGLLSSAALITTIGFVLSCTLSFVLAARGLRMAAGQSNLGARAWVSDVITGLLIAAPVFWMFTQFLAINLPGLTQSGWL
jgi:putative tricarboxylic transport membrane protein